MGEIEALPAPPTAPIKWFEVEAMLNIVIMANSLGPNANNISAAARSELYKLNESLTPIEPTPAEKML